MQYDWLRFVRCALFAVVLAPALGGCSFLWPMFESSSKEDFSTGSIAKPIDTKVAVMPIFAQLSEEDVRRARGALSIALDPGGNGKSVAWENPETKASGMFEPKDLAFASPRGVCRTFKAHVKHGTEAKDYAGTACKDDYGQWDVVE